jgi:hypothetical protein
MSPVLILHTKLKSAIADLLPRNRHNGPQRFGAFGGHTAAGQYSVTDHGRLRHSDKRRCSESIKEYREQNMLH